MKFFTMIAFLSSLSFAQQINAMHAKSKSENNLSKKDIEYHQRCFETAMKKGLKVWNRASYHDSDSNIPLERPALTKRQSAPEKILLEPEKNDSEE